LKARAIGLAEILGAVRRDVRRAIGHRRHRAETDRGEPESADRREEHCDRNRDRHRLLRLVSLATHVGKRCAGDNNE